jgi:glycosyltransferase involved in cell wall biosynthesis
MSNNIEYASVSTIIPCYKSTETLERAVVSVWNQTLRPKELILVDDGSPDDGATVALMHELQNKYGKDWITIIDLGADLGVSTARNSGWEKATQKYVAFLDSDDAWHLEKIAIQYNLMEENCQYVMSGHHFEILGEESSAPVLDAGYTTEEFSFKKQLFKNQFVAPSVMVRSNSKIRFQAGRSDMDDHLLWLELASEYGPGLKINLPLAFLFKGQWGVSGLSSRLWIMEKGNLKNFLHLYATKKIGLSLCCIMIVQSLARFTRRLFIHYIGKRLVSKEMKDGKNLRNLGENR